MFVSKIGEVRIQDVLYDPMRHHGDALFTVDGIEIEQHFKFVVERQELDEHPSVHFAHVEGQYLPYEHPELHRELKRRFGFGLDNSEFVSMREALEEELEAEEEIISDIRELMAEAEYADERELAAGLDLDDEPIQEIDETDECVLTR